MKAEIEKLIAELRSDPESFWNQNDAADHLQRILDADPVSKLEAMGYTVVLTGEGAKRTNQSLLERELLKGRDNG